MSKKSVAMMVVACLGLGAVLGSLAREALNEPAMAAGGRAKSGEVVWSGPPRIVNYRVEGQELQKALQVDEISVHGNLVVFRGGQEIRAAVSLYALGNFQVVARD